VAVPPPTDATATVVYLFLGTRRHKIGDLCIAMFATHLYVALIGAPPGTWNEKAVGQHGQGPTRPQSD